MSPTEKKLQELKQRRAAMELRLRLARGDYRAAKARKNYAESQLAQLDEQIDLIQQGQLALDTDAEAIS